MKSGVGTMIYRSLADLMVSIHLLFILFVLLGALLCLLKRWWALMHLPALGWALLLEFNGWVCPLTPLENRFRELGVEAGYAGGFVEHYLIPLVYPQGLQQADQWLLGLLLLLLNGGIYLWLLWRFNLK
jgi:hypothetical protein